MKLIAFIVLFSLLSCSPKVALKDPKSNATQSFQSSDQNAAALIEVINNEESK